MGPRAGLDGRIISSPPGFDPGPLALAIAIPTELPGLLWNVCADLKVVALLTGLQGGCTKFCCFLCGWHRRARDRHCHVKQWPHRGEMILGQKNVAHRALVDRTKMYVPPFHTNVGSIKIFVKAIYIEYIYIYIYTGCNRRNGPDFGSLFLMLNYTDITQNTYIQSGTVTEIIAREKCGLHRSRRTICRP